MSALTDRRTMLAGACALAGATQGARVRLSSKKKGFCLVPKKDPDWEIKLRLLKAKWFYSWGPAAPKGVPPGITFIPMQWGKWGCTAEAMTSIKKSGHKTLLGFNEPDQRSQANMSVETALKLWPLLMDTGLRLGSPAGVHADGEWMMAFMEEVKRRGYRVDYVTMHSYMGKSSRHFLSKVKRIHKLYRKPVWITEFAVGDWTARADKPNKYSPQDVLRFMEDALPGLEKLDCVERYAWFSARPDRHSALGTSALFNKDGSLSPAGEFYASI